MAYSEKLVKVGPSWTNGGIDLDWASKSDILQVFAAPWGLCTLYKVPGGNLLEGQLDLIHLKLVFTSSFQANLQTVSENSISEGSNINFYNILKRPTFEFSFHISVFGFKVYILRPKKLKLTVFEYEC